MKEFYFESPVIYYVECSAERLIDSDDVKYDIFDGIYATGETVFIFPGDTTIHNQRTATITNTRYGSGLAAVANDLTLKWSLPKIGMGIPPDHNTWKMAEFAIAELYRMVGSGYNVMLPVRPHTADTYFIGDLDITVNGTQNPLVDSISQGVTSWEPSWWGGQVTIPNPALAEYYLRELNKFIAFVALLQTSPDPDYCQLRSFMHERFLYAYNAGRSTANRGFLPGLTKTILKYPLDRSVIFSEGVSTYSDIKNKYSITNSIIFGIIEFFNNLLNAILMLCMRESQPQGDAELIIEEPSARISGLR